MAPIPRIHVNGAASPLLMHERPLLARVHAKQSSPVASPNETTALALS